MDQIKLNVKLSLSRSKRRLKSLENSIEKSMPKKRDGGKIKNKAVKMESPSKRQTLLTTYYTSPQKNSDSQIKSSFIYKDVIIKPTPSLVNPTNNQNCENVLIDITSSQEDSHHECDFNPVSNNISSPYNNSVPSTTDKGMTSLFRKYEQKHKNVEEKILKENSPLPNKKSLPSVERSQISIDKIHCDNAKPSTSKLLAVDEINSFGISKNVTLEKSGKKRTINEILPVSNKIPRIALNPSEVTINKVHSAMVASPSKSVFCNNFSDLKSTLPSSEHDDKYSVPFSNYGDIEIVDETKIEIAKMIRNSELNMLKEAPKISTNSLTPIKVGEQHSLPGNSQHELKFFTPNKMNSQISLTETPKKNVNSLTPKKTSAKAKNNKRGMNCLTPGKVNAQYSSTVTTNKVIKSLTPKKINCQLSSIETPRQDTNSLTPKKINGQFSSVGTPTKGTNSLTPKKLSTQFSSVDHHKGGVNYPIPDKINSQCSLTAVTPKKIANSLTPKKMSSQFSPVENHKNSVNYMTSENMNTQYSLPVTPKKDVNSLTTNCLSPQRVLPETSIKAVHSMILTDHTSQQPLLETSKKDANSVTLIKIGAQHSSTETTKTLNSANSITMNNIDELSLKETPKKNSNSLTLIKIGAQRSLTESTKNVNCSHSLTVSSLRAELSKENPRKDANSSTPIKIVEHKSLVESLKTSANFIPSRSSNADLALTESVKMSEHSLTMKNISEEHIPYNCRFATSVTNSLTPERNSERQTIVATSKNKAKSAKQKKSSTKLSLAKSVKRKSKSLTPKKINPQHSLTDSNNEANSSTPQKMVQRLQKNTPRKGANSSPKGVKHSPKKTKKDANSLPPKGIERSPKKTPKKNVNSLTPKKLPPTINIEKLSPKIRRRPGKYFDADTMPNELKKSPSKSPRKTNTPRKRNLMNDFNQSSPSNQKKLDSFICRNSDVPSIQSGSNPDSYKELLEDDVLVNWSEIEKVINDTETMERIRLENAVRNNTTSVASTSKADNTIQNQLRSTYVMSPNSSPVKAAKNKQNDSNKNSSVFIDYLVINPIILAANRNDVLDDDLFKDMFKKFTDLPQEGQLLFGKMYERTPVWYRVDEDLVKNYSSVFGDVKGLVATLKQNGLVKDDLLSLDLLDMLNMLNVKEMKMICKHFNVKTSNGVMNKDNLIKALLNHATSQKVLFGNLANRIKAHVAKELGQCIRLSDDFHDMFNLLVVLATYPYFRDEEKKRLSDLVYRLHQLKSRSKSLPSYVCKADVAFCDLQHLTDYVEALKFVAQYSTLVENKDWVEASKIVIDAKLKFSNFLAKQSNIQLLGKLGGHLFRFTAGYQYAYCLSSGITVLKKDPQYTDDCIEILLSLLSQRHYLTRKRGLWYEEMALIQQKMKELPAACQSVIDGLEDDTIDIIKRKMLSQRASTLLKRKTNTIPDGTRLRLHSLMVPDNFKPESHTIAANCHEGVAGRKQIFFRECDDGSTEYCSVEEMVIGYYTNKASPTYKNAMHDEGRTLMTLVVACFYDIIYCNMEGESMFHSNLQAYPLDWGGKHFYKRREKLIQGHLEELRMGGLSSIMTVLQNICDNSEGNDSAVSWDYLKSQKLSSIKDLLECLSPEVFLKIAEHVIMDYKLYHSGFPDLILWDPPTKKCLIVEVKGPNDKLSPSQMVWLENLRNFGANALVCHVENTGSRKRKAT